MNKKIILFNGPPRSGKDTIAKYINQIISKSEIIKITKPIKEKTHQFYNIDKPYDYFDDEKIKDSPSIYFNNMTPREAYIKTSNELKKEYGKNIIMDLFIKEIEKSDSNIIINSDIGDNNELNRIMEIFDHENIILFRIYRDGKTFKKDCRKYIENDERIFTKDIKNIENKEIEYLVETMKYIYNFLN